MPRLLRGAVAVLQLIAAVQLLGAAAVILWEARGARAALPLALLFGMFAAWPLLAALGLWRARRWGSALTVGWQLLQLPQLVTTHGSWLASLPVAVSVGLTSAGRFHGEIWPVMRLQLSTDPPTGLTWAGVNLVAVAALGVVLLVRPSRLAAG